ncbi:MAG: 2-succinylbenzoate--CoA ligase [Candidatus Celerinatantimonas neptuna]|nr:MAG: 2-succinylbenzoate--CoA ligase [Candidatus Celerinatantimonas neptuna]
MTKLTDSPLLKQFHSQPDAAAIHMSGQTITYRQLTEQVAALVWQIQKNHIPQGSHIGWISDTAWHGILLQLACLHGGWIFCAISPHFRPDQLNHAIETLKLDVLISPKAHHRIKPIVLDFSITRTAKTLPKELDPHQWVDLILTSGSSGSPKAVIHSWSNLYFSAKGSNACIPLHPQDSWLASLPLFHVGGQAIIWRVLLAGCSLSLVPEDDSIENVLSYLPVTHLSLVPTQLYRLLKHSNFNAQSLHLKHILIGGGPCNESKLNESSQRGFITYISYGCSEMSSQVSTGVIGHIGQVTGAGYLLDHRELKIENHHVYLRGKTLSPGYFQSGEIIPLTDHKGWYYSGDNGYLDNKQLIITGRNDHMFICGGENIQPEEIEVILLSHPSILEAVIIGHDDPEYGQRPVAFIRSHSDVTKSTLDQFLIPKLSRFKRPVRYYQLPQQTTLKAQRRQLSQLLTPPIDYSIVEIQ